MPEQPDFHPAVAAPVTPVMLRCATFVVHERELDGMTRVSSFVDCLVECKEGYWLIHNAVTQPRSFYNRVISMLAMTFYEPGVPQDGEDMAT